MSLFKLIDSSGNGFITPDELSSFFPNSTLDWLAIIRHLNVTEDNLVDREDNRLTFINFQRGITSVQQGKSMHDANTLNVLLR